MDYRGDFVNYSEYLQSPEWLRLRTLKIASVGSKCETCGSTDRLHVHHLKYVRRELTMLRHLLVVCENCHRSIHRVLGNGTSATGLTRAQVLSMFGVKKHRGTRKISEKKRLKRERKAERKRLRKLGLLPPIDKPWEKHARATDAGPSTQYGIY